ncbi:MAG: hypothetical protein Tsb002_35590 [Wenzhouxiangellaceae bacterium]
MKQLVLIIALCFCTTAYAQLARDIEGVVMVGGAEPLARRVVTLDGQGLAIKPRRLVEPTVTINTVR